MLFSAFNIRAQIHIVSGNLEFTVGDGKNVTFQTSGGGTVVINDIDILKIAKTVKKHILLKPLLKKCGIFRVEVYLQK